MRTKRIHHKQIKFCVKLNNINHKNKTVTILCVYCSSFINLEQKMNNDLLIPFVKRLTMFLRLLLFFSPHLSLNVLINKVLSQRKECVRRLSQTNLLMDNKIVSCKQTQPLGLFAFWRFFALRCLSQTNFVFCTNIIQTILTTLVHKQKTRF